jgi:hypothetical protein
MSVKPMPREDKERRLFDEYDAAVWEYSQRVRELADRQRGEISQGEYAKLYRECERARVLCETARLALESFRNSN